MIKVIHLRDSPFVGGPEKQILGHCVRLDASRFEPVIASFARDNPNSFLQEAMALGLKSESLPDGKLAAPVAAKRLFEVVRDAADCVVIASGFKADLTAALARVPWIAWFHGYTAATTRVRLYEALDMIALRRACEVIAVCERAACQLRAAGLPRVTVVPNAVDVEAIADGGTRKSARVELGFRDEPVVGAVSRLSPEKGVTYFIEAAPIVLAAHPEARFVVVGDGPLGARVRRRAVALGVGDRVRFVGHRVDAVRLMRAMDIFVLPSLRENLPIALLEAMACGVSVVATDVGGVAEVLHGTGIAPVDPGSADAIAASVIRLLGDRALRADLAAAGTVRVRDYDFGRQVRLMQGIIARSVGQDVNKM